MTSIWKVPNIQKIKSRDLVCVFLVLQIDVSTRNSTWILNTYWKLAIILNSLRLSQKIWGSKPLWSAFGSAIPDKVNSFGVANTPVARITWVRMAFETDNWKLQWQNALIQTEIWVTTQIKNQTDIWLFILSRPGKPTSFFTLNRNRRSTASGPGSKNHWWWVSLIEMIPRGISGRSLTF